MSDDYERERELRIRAEEDHRAAVESLETYEERIREIADHVLGIQPPDVATIVLLDAIERRCGEERIAARQAEAEVARLRRIEACAVAYLDAWEADDDGTVEMHALRSTREALRAALKKGESDG